MVGLLQCFCACSYHLSDYWVPFAEISVNLVNIVRQIIWFCPWKENINYLNHIANFKYKFLLGQRRDCRKNSCFWKIWSLISCKMSTTYLCVIYFLSWSFLAVTYFVTLLFCYCFFSILQIYKDSQFNNTKMDSKIQVQNKTQTLRKSYKFLNKVCHLEDT